MFFLLSYQCDRAFSLHRTEKYLFLDQRKKNNNNNIKNIKYMKRNS